MLDKKKLITQPNSLWYKLMTVMYENIGQILNFGDQWYSKKSSPVHNQFWHDLFKDWQSLNKLEAQND